MGVNATGYLRKDVKQAQDVDLTIKAQDMPGVNKIKYTDRAK